MSSSDWLNIILALSGLFAGAFVSWIFFRAQQKTDFNKLIQMLTDISGSVSILKDTSKISDKVELARDLTTIRVSVDNLSHKVNGLSGEILTDIRGQLDILMRAVSEQFDRQIEKSRTILIGSIERELKNSIPSSPDREILSGKLVDLFNNILHTMGEYQRITIRNEAETTLNNVEGKVTGAVTAVSKEAKQIVTKVDALSLPPSSRAK